MLVVKELRVVTELPLEDELEDGVEADLILSDIL